MKLLKRLWSRSRERRVSTIAAYASLYSEAQLVGWVPSPLELQPPISLAQPSRTQVSDAEALVARFYSCQEC